MSILTKVQEVERLLALYSAKPFTQAKALVAAQSKLKEIEADVQTLAFDLRRDCCNSSCHLDDTLKKLKGE